ADAALRAADGDRKTRTLPAAATRAVPGDQRAGHDRARRRTRGGRPGRARPGPGRPPPVRPDPDRPGPRAAGNGPGSGRGHPDRTGPDPGALRGGGVALVALPAGDRRGSGTGPVSGHEPSHGVITIFRVLAVAAYRGHVAGDTASGRRGLNLSETHLGACCDIVRDTL